MTVTPIPYARRLRALVDELVSAVDELHAAGYTVPPMIPVGVAQIGIGLNVIVGQELERNAPDMPQEERAALAQEFVHRIAQPTPTPIPPAFRRDPTPKKENP